MCQFPLEIKGVHHLFKKMMTVHDEDVRPRVDTGTRDKANLALFASAKVLDKLFSKSLILAQSER